MEKFHGAIRHALGPGASMRQRQEAAIMAAGTGDIAALDRFIEDFGCRVNWIIPGERRTALHAAVIFNQPGCVKALLNYGADPGIRDKHGKSSLDIATETALYIDTDPVYRLLVARVTEVATLGGSVVDSSAVSQVLSQDSLFTAAPGDLEVHAPHTNLHDKHLPRDTHVAVTTATAAAGGAIAAATAAAGATDASGAAGGAGRKLRARSGGQPEGTVRPPRVTSQALSENPWPAAGDTAPAWSPPGGPEATGPVGAAPSKHARKSKR
jgi:hypothetical protein